MIEPQQALAEGWFEAASVQTLGGGHIHDTWLAIDQQGDRFVLQKLNAHVFPDPVRVMQNVSRITNFVSPRAPGLVPQLVQTRTGDPFWRDARGGVWRMWVYVARTRVIDATQDEACVEAAGAAFGRFQRILAEFPEPPLDPAIPDYFELDGYLRAFDGLPSSVKRSLPAECALIDAHRGLADQLPAQGDYIHGDCKLNNLLFDVDGFEVRCILDLDTVMRGNWAWDFGDLVRSVLRTSRVDKFERLFAAISRGFLGATGRTESPQMLIAAPCYVTFMLGVRRLTDHLEGDRYFKVAARGENLEQAQRLFRLLETIEARSDSLTAAVSGIDGIN